MKEFNVTGLCIPEKHFMVDISGKVKKIAEMVDKGAYFTVNRPRQFGKTTTFNQLVKELSKKYVVIKASFEGVGDDIFKTEEKFCEIIFNIFAKSVRFTNKELYEKLKSYADKTRNFNDLSENITDMIDEYDNNMVLIIDEVDKSSGNRVFMQFLGVLRNKYLAMASKEDLTFKSVILGGVNDIKNIKLQIRDEKDRVFNSPWNIAADFKIDMTFSSEEIETMLNEYVNETEIDMDVKLLSKTIRSFTDGYPYLVSRLCKNIDEYLGKEWTLKGLERSIKMTLNEHNTLFDDVIKNIENYDEIKTVVYQILVEGKQILYNPFVYEKGLMYGILSEYEGKLTMNNKIFEMLLYDYLIAQKDIQETAAKFTQVDKNEVLDDEDLNMEKVLLKFQEFMYEQYREEDEHFYETNGRLIFLAYLKPILNGKGFSFVEPQTRKNKRMDVVITYGNKKYIVELKIWNGEVYREKGVHQLGEYMIEQGVKEGYLLTFNFNKNKKYTAGWIKEEEKRIFEVMV
jgi:Predicted AAA-ATPase.